MRTSIAILGLLGLVVLASGAELCPFEHCHCPNPLNLASFDTFQVETAPVNESRRAETIEFLNASDYQIVCLQSLFELEKKQQFIDQLMTKYPHNYFADIPAGNCGSVGCRESEVQALQMCITTWLGVQPLGCSAVDIFNQPCLNGFLSFCQAELNALDTQCRACLEVDPSNTLEDRINSCLTRDFEFVEGCERVFGGLPDTLILSTYEIVHTSFSIFQSSMFYSASALYALIRTPQLGDVNVFCTSIQNLLEDQVNLNQTRELLSFVGSQRIQGLPTVVLGNFNSGPSIEVNVTEEVNIDSYDLLLSRNWKSSFIATGTPNCSVCEDNFLVLDDAPNTLVDHIWALEADRNYCLQSADRFAVTPIVNISGDQSIYPELDYLAQPSGSTIEQLLATADFLIPLSSHYGIEAKLCPLFISVTQTQTQTATHTTQVTATGTVPTVTATATATATGVITITETETATRTATETQSGVETTTQTATATHTVPTHTVPTHTVPTHTVPTHTQTQTVTHTTQVTGTGTEPTRTATATATATHTVTVTGTATRPTETATETRTRTGTETGTATETRTGTATGTGTETATHTETATRTATITATITETVTETETETSETETSETSETFETTSETSETFETTSETSETLETTSETSETFETTSETFETTSETSETLETTSETSETFETTSETSETSETFETTSETSETTSEILETTSETSETSSETTSEIFETTSETTETSETFENALPNGFAGFLKNTPFDQAIDEDGESSENVAAAAIPLLALIVAQVVALV